MITSINIPNTYSQDLYGWTGEETIINLLKSLAEKVNKIVFKGVQISNNIIQALKGCKRLQAIHFESCPTLTNKQVGEIINTVKDTLKEFQVVGKAKLTDAVWNKLLPATYLTSINLLTCLDNMATNQGFYEFLKQNQGIIEHLNATAFYAEDPIAYGLRFPNLKTFTWCATAEESIRILKEHSPKLELFASCTEPNVFHEPFSELFQGFNNLKKIDLYKTQINLNGMNNWVPGSLKNITFYKCLDVNKQEAPIDLVQLSIFESNTRIPINFVEASFSQITRKPQQTVNPLFKNETTQWSAPSITEDGICYFLCGEKLIEYNLLTGKESIKNAALYGLTKGFGSQCCANNTYAITAPPQKQNTSTEVSVINLGDNKPIFNEKIETNFLLSDIEILQYEKGSSEWFTVIRLNNDDLTPMFLKIFSLQKNYDTTSILFDLGYAPATCYPPSCNCMIMIDESTAALLSFSGDMGKKHPVAVFYIDLQAAKITNTFTLPPLNNDEMTPLVSAIAGGPNSPYPVAVLTPKGKVFYGPIENEITQSFDMGKQFAQNYNAFTFINKNRLAFFAKNMQGQYIVGFYDLEKGHLSQVVLNDLMERSTRSHVVRMKMLNNGKLAVAVNTQGLSAKNSPPFARIYVVDVPSEN